MTNTSSTPKPEGPSLVASLRALVPARPLLFSEALRIAELQANRLLELTGTTDSPTPSELITDLPHVRVEYRDLPTSGMSFWDGHCWVICLNVAEPTTRQRFTLFHEFKHILDHRKISALYRGTARQSGGVQAEQAADYFAGCVLMPKRLIKRSWGDRLQRPTVLASLFDVSPRAMDVRLAQLGLTEPRVRCAPMNKLRYRTPRPDIYLRQASPIPLPEGVAA